MQYITEAEPVKYLVPTGIACCFLKLHRLSCAGLCSPRHTVRVPVPLLPRPTPHIHIHRPPQPAVPTHCCTAQQPQSCSRHISGAVAAGASHTRGRSATTLQQSHAGKSASSKGRARKGATGTKTLSLSRGHHENLQSRLVRLAVVPMHAFVTEDQ